MDSQCALTCSILIISWPGSIVSSEHTPMAAASLGLSAAEHPRFSALLWRHKVCHFFSESCCSMLSSACAAGFSLCL